MKYYDQRFCVYLYLSTPISQKCRVQFSPNILYVKVRFLYVKDKILIEKVQKQFTWMIPHLKQLQYVERLARLKPWSLEDNELEQT